MALMNRASSNDNSNYKDHKYLQPQSMQQRWEQTQLGGVILMRIPCLILYLWVFFYAPEVGLKYLALVIIPAVFWYSLPEPVEWFVRRRVLEYLEGMMYGNNTRRRRYKAD